MIPVSKLSANVCKWTLGESAKALCILAEKLLTKESNKHVTTGGWGASNAPTFCRPLTSKRRISKDNNVIGFPAPFVHPPLFGRAVPEQ